MVGFKVLSAVAAVAGLVAAHPGHGLDKRALPTGQLITKCTKPNVVALTFDDGPAQYTEQLLTTLRGSGHKATFFVNGDNYGYIYNYNSTLKRMISDGHQIGSHTWSHADMTKLTDAQLRTELLRVEEALDNILGYHSKYLRPPFLATNNAALATIESLNYYVIMVDIDTLDWQYNSVDVTIPRQNYENGYNAGGTISLAHDPEEVTVKQTVPWIINFLNGKGVKSVTVGECLGEDPQNWYERKAVVSARPASSAGASSTKASSSIKASSSVYVSSAKASSSAMASSIVPSAKASSYYSSVSAAPKSSVSAYSAASSARSSISQVRGLSSVSAESASVSASRGRSSVSAALAKSSSIALGRASSAPAIPSSRGSNVRLSSAAAQASARPSVGPVSGDGSCGANNGGASCGEGECCSPYGWCGLSKAYCGRGCQSAFGTCDAPSGDEPTGPITQDGTCGGETGNVCASGECCSRWGWCGTSSDHCENKQEAFSG